MKTGWTDEYLLSRPHCQNKRRFNTYRLLDRAEDSRPVTVIPAVGENLSMPSIDSVQRNYQEQADSLKESLGYAPAASGEEIQASEEFMAAWFERRYGRKPIPIEEITHG
jgi:hypothetical protein